MTNQFTMYSSVHKANTKAIFSIRVYEIYMPKVKCGFCEKLKESSKCRSVSSTTYKWFNEYLQAKKINFNEKELFLCSSCIGNFYNLKSSMDSSPMSIDDASPSDSSSIYQADTSLASSIDSESDELTLENVLYAGSNQNRCVICRKNRESARKMITMPKPARLDLLILHRLYAPHNVRCCSEHILKHDRLSPMNCVEMYDRQKLKATLQPQELLLVIEDLLTLIQEAIKAPRLDFRDPMLSDDDYLTWTGWNMAQFDIMLDMLSSSLRSSCNREPRNALAIFWIKAKTNLSFSQIGSLFNYTGDSENRRKRVADTFDSVRSLLVRDFVPLYLGIGHLSRNQALLHNTAFSKEFWDNKVTIIWDGKCYWKIHLRMIDLHRIFIHAYLPYSHFIF